MDSDELRNKWIADALARTGKTQKGLAQALGLDPAAANRLIKGARRLKASELPLVERYLGERAPDRAGGFADGPPSAPADFATIPVHDLQAALPQGEPLSDLTPQRFLMLDRNWIGRICDNPRALVAFEHGNEQLLVDVTRTNLRHDGTYVLRIDEILSKRSVSTHPALKTVTVRSDDPAQPVYENLSPDDLDVIGRVVWIGRIID